MTDANRGQKALMATISGADAVRAPTLDSPPFLLIQSSYPFWLTNTIS